VRNLVSINYRQTPIKSRRRIKISGHLPISIFSNFKYLTPCSNLIVLIFHFLFTPIFDINDLTSATIGLLQTLRENSNFHDLKFIWYDIRYETTA